MQRARLVVVPGAGHSVPGDNPDAFTEALQEFLEDVERGDFEPASKSEPPPLEKLMEDHSAASRRGSSLIVLIAAGAAAVIALGGAGMLVQRQKKKRLAAREAEQQRHSLRGRARNLASERMPALTAIDVDHARERAAEVVARLGAVGAQSGKRARQSLSDVDLERARSAAHDALAALGETSRHAPEAVRTAVTRVDRKKARKRGSMAMSFAKGAGAVAMRAALRAASRKQAALPPAKKRKIARWRS
jgi:hypothetical protein